MKSGWAFCIETDSDEDFTVDQVPGIRQNRLKFDKSLNASDKCRNMDAQLSNLKFDSSGLIPAIIQDVVSGQVLMMAWMNRDSLEKTIQSGKTHFFSRSRNKLWLKGETSGHVQHVKSIAVDCDEDVLLIKVEQVGAACHEGFYSCFFREYQKGAGELKIVGKRMFEPEKVYGK